LINFSLVTGNPVQRGPLDVLFTLVRGLDVAPGDDTDLAQSLLATTGDNATQVLAEIEVLSAFCDIQTLRGGRCSNESSDNRPDSEHLIEWLAKRDNEDSVFSDAFHERLDAGLYHVQAGSTEESELGYFRLFRSIRRGRSLSKPVSFILHRWLRSPETIPATPDLNHLLERLIAITDRWS